jgi:hypothetical protein
MVGVVDVRFDRARIARTTDGDATELCRQTELLRARAGAQPLVRINVGAPAPAAARQVADARPSRKSWTETLIERPELEMKWWIIWAAVAIFCAAASAASLISLPVGVYLFHARQPGGAGVRLPARRPPQRPDTRGRHAR